MNDHTARVTGPLLATLDELRSGRATLLDLCSAVESAASALDNAAQPLPDLLRMAARNLESAYFTSDASTHQSAGEDALAPVLAVLKASQ